MERVKLYAVTVTVDPIDVGEIRVTLDLRGWQAEQVFVDLAHLIGRERVADLLEGLNAAQ